MEHLEPAPKQSQCIRVAVGFAVNQDLPWGVHQQQPTGIARQPGDGNIVNLVRLRAEEGTILLRMYHIAAPCTTWWVGAATFIAVRHALGETIVTGAKYPTILIGEHAANLTATGTSRRYGQGYGQQVLLDGRPHIEAPGSIAVQSR